MIPQVTTVRLIAAAARRVLLSSHTGSAGGIASCRIDIVRSYDVCSCVVFIPYRHRYHTNHPQSTVCRNWVYSVFQVCYLHNSLVESD